MDLVLFSLYIRLDHIDITLFKFNRFSLFTFSWYEDWDDKPDAHGLFIEFLGIEIYNHSDHYYTSTHTKNE